MSNRASCLIADVSLSEWSNRTDVRVASGVRPISTAFCVVCLFRNLHAFGYNPAESICKRVVNSALIDFAFDCEDIWRSTERPRTSFMAYKQANKNSNGVDINYHLSCGPARLTTTRLMQACSAFCHLCIADVVYAITSNAAILYHVWQAAHNALPERKDYQSMTSPLTCVSFCSSVEHLHAW